MQLRHRCTPYHLGGSLTWMVFYKLYTKWGLTCHTQLPRILHVTIARRHELDFHDVGSVGIVMMMLRELKQSSKGVHGGPRCPSHINGCRRLHKGSSEGRESCGSKTAYGTVVLILSPWVDSWESISAYWLHRLEFHWVVLETSGSAINSEV